MKATRSQGIDIRKMEAAFRRAAYTAVYGTREERSGRFISFTPVSSQYDVVSGDLDVRFVDGRTFRYSDVPPDVYKALVDAESKRAFFNAQIRGCYSYREL